MPLQTSIAAYPAYGVIGDQFDDGPHRGQPFSLLSANAANNVFGRAFSKIDEGVAAAGNTATNYVFAGIMVNAKEHALRGDAAGVLNPSLTLPNGVIVTMVTMGSWFVTLPGAAAIGDLVVFNNTTGILNSIARNAALPVGFSFAYGEVDRFDVESAGLAVITLTPGLKPPVLA